MSEEGLQTTPNHLIHIESPIPFDTDEFLNKLQRLMIAAYEGQDNGNHDLVAHLSSHRWKLPAR